MAEPTANSVIGMAKSLFGEELKESEPLPAEKALTEEMMLLQQLEAEAAQLESTISELQLEETVLREMESEAQSWGLKIEDLKAQQQVLEEQCKEQSDTCSMLNANIPAPSHTAPSAFVLQYVCEKCFMFSYFCM